MCCCLHFVLCLVVPVDLQPPGGASGTWDGTHGRLSGSREIGDAEQFCIRSSDLLTIDLLFVLIWHDFWLLSNDNCVFVI